MKLCFIVDYRSPIARNWISYFVDREHEVHVISSYPYSGTTSELSSFHSIPIGFAGLAEQPRLRHLAAVSQSSGSPAHTSSQELQRFGKRLGNVARATQMWIAPLDVHRQKHRVRNIVQHIEPDLVHAMRIPFEGILASVALVESHVPLLISVWGNDFTLFASRHAAIARATRRAMQRATALHADCHRDARLSREWGLAINKRTLVVPSGGGVQAELFHPASTADTTSIEACRKRWGIPSRGPILFNPRNFRPSYVRNDTFFDAIPLVLAECPDAVFVCVGMSGNPIAERRRLQLSTPDCLRLLPSVTRAEMGDLFRIADITVSPSVHDGTPNTLLEGMACGAFPVAGDVESLREWLTDGVNGLLCDPREPTSLAVALVRAIKDSALRERAARVNQALIAERAQHRRVMSEALSFYEQVVEEHTRTRRLGQPVSAC